MFLADQESSRTPRVALLRLIAATCVIASLVTTATADGTGPVSINEIRQMKRARTKVSEIVSVIESRGLAFDLNKKSLRTLRALGFSRSHLERLDEVVIKVDDASDDNAGDEGRSPISDRGSRNDPPNAGGRQAAPNSKTPDPVGFGRGSKLSGLGDAKPEPLKLAESDESVHAKLAARLAIAAKKSETGAEVQHTKYIAIIAKKAVAAKHSPDIKRLEGLIQRRFPNPIGGGVDPRAANIAIFASRYNYKKWIRTLFKAYADDGIQFETEGDPVKAALSTNSLFLHGVYCVCTEGLSPIEQRHRISFAVGFLYMDQLTRFRGTDIINTGFGNLTEEVLMGQPTVMVKSGYVNREIQGKPARWAALVRKRFKDRQIAVQNTVAYSTQSMDVPQYAEAWSLNSLLATSPRRYSKLVTAIREGRDTFESIESIYEVDEKELFKRWQKYAGAKR